jgi:hypothetical protein
MVGSDEDACRPARRIGGCFLVEADAPRLLHLRTDQPVAVTTCLRGDARQRSSGHCLASPVEGAESHPSTASVHGRRFEALLRCHFRRPEIRGGPAGAAQRDDGVTLVHSRPPRNRSPLGFRTAATTPPDRSDRTPALAFLRRLPMRSRRIMGWRVWRTRQLASARSRCCSRTTTTSCAAGCDCCSMPKRTSRSWPRRPTFRSPFGSCTHTPTDCARPRSQHAWRLEHRGDSEACEDLAKYRNRGVDDGRGPFVRAQGTGGRPERLREEAGGSRRARWRHPCGRRWRPGGCRVGDVQ